MAFAAEESGINGTIPPSDDAPAALAAAAASEEEASPGDASGFTAGEASDSCEPASAASDAGIEPDADATSSSSPVATAGGESESDSEAAGTEKAPSSDEEADAASDAALAAQADGAAVTNETVANEEIEAASEADYQSTHQNVYRLYNPNSGEHFYTVSLTEAVSVCEAGWQWESIGWVAPTSGAAVYRLYNPNAGDHHYTCSAAERDKLKALGWRYEGVCWYSDSSSGLSVYREYNPNAVAGAHNFTTSSSEDISLGKAGWKREGTAWYATNGSTIAIQGRWITTSAWGSKQKLWLGSDGSIARSRIVYASEGAGIDCYVGSNGVVQTGLISLSSGSYYAASNGALAPSFSLVVSNAQGTDSQTLYSSPASGGVYVFLPASASTSSVELCAFAVDGSTTKVTISGNGISAVVSGATTLSLSALDSLLSSSGSATLTMAYGRSSSAKLVIMKSASIDALFVNSADAQNYGRSYIEGSVDHSTKANVAVTLLNASGGVVYDADDLASGALSTIKGRGNSTWSNGEKKPYQISLSTKADLLETGDSSNKAKKWILLACSADVTMMHTAIAYDMGLELGMLGMEGAFVDLYYDGEYRGTYYLCEKVEVKSGRVSITDLESAIEKACKKAGVDLDSLPTAQAVNDYGYTYQYVDGAVDPEDITGGYLIEFDGAYYESETCWFKTSVGAFVVKSPECCSAACMKYISEFVQQAIDNLNINVFYEDAAGLIPAFDLDSLAETYAISEFFKNIDAFYSSTYFYKDADAEDGTYAPLMAEPLWDFDASMGLRTDATTNAFRSYEGFTLPNAWWVNKSSVLLERVREVLADSVCPLVADVLLGGVSATGSNGILHSIAYYRSLIQYSQRMNEVRFGLTSFGNELDPLATYQANVTYLRNWLGWRAKWVSANVSQLVAVNGTVSNPTTVYRGVDYSDVYDFYYYQAMNPDVAALYGNDAAATLEHFVLCGMAEGRIASYNFSWTVYRARYSDLRAAFGNDAAAYYRHYIEYGFYEGRSAI